MPSPPPCPDICTGGPLMNTLQITSLIGLLVYFAVLLFAVSKDKANQNVLDYFFAGRSLPFWALSITFIASWWGAGVGPFHRGSGLYRRVERLLVLRRAGADRHLFDGRGRQSHPPGGLPDPGQDDGRPLFRGCFQSALGDDPVSSSLCCWCSRPCWSLSRP